MRYPEAYVKRILSWVERTDMGCGREEEQKGLILNDYKDQPFGGLIPWNREVYCNHRAPAPGTVQRYGAGQVQT